MKCQILFSRKNINLLSAEFALRVVKVKPKVLVFFSESPG